MSRRKRRVIDAPSRGVDPGKVRIACVTRGHPHAQTATALAAVARHYPTLPPPSYVVGGMSVTSTRNVAVSEFLAGRGEALIMVDDDIVPPDHILELCDRLDDFGIVGAAYPLFTKAVGHAMPFSAAYPLEGLPGGWEHEGLVECLVVGFGCVAIHRRVFEALGHPSFQEVFDENGDLIMDDAQFCRRARAAGFRVAADFGVVCDHLKEISLLDLATRLIAWEENQDEEGTRSGGAS